MSARKNGKKDKRQVGVDQSMPHKGTNGQMAEHQRPSSDVKKVVESTNASDQCMGAPFLLEANIYKGKEGKEQIIVSTPSSENSRNKQSLENKAKGIKKRNKSSSAFPQRSSKRLAGIKVDLRSQPPTPPDPKTRHQATSGQIREAKSNTTIANPPMIQENNHGDLKNLKPESPVNGLWTDPCIEFAVKTLTGEISVNKGKTATNICESPIGSPLEEFWMDPCIKFAVKMLTGEIPVGEDYLQLPATSSSSFPLPNDV